MPESTGVGKVAKGKLLSPATVCDYLEKAINIPISHLDMWLSQQAGKEVSKSASSCNSIRPTGSFHYRSFKNKDDSIYLRIEDQE